MNFFIEEFLQDHFELQLFISIVYKELLQFQAWFSWIGVSLRNNLIVV
jgi:hypothetical protein